MGGIAIQFDGLAPDPDHTDFMIWDLHCNDPPSLLASEDYFDGVTATALPYGWS
jgi:hypothetical protein